MLLRVNSSEFVCFNKIFQKFVFFLFYTKKQKKIERQIFIGIVKGVK